MSAQRRIVAFLDLAENDVEAAEALAEKRNRYSAYPVSRLRRSSSRPCFFTTTSNQVLSTT